MDEQNHKSCIIAEDQTHVDKPRRLFLCDNAKQYDDLIEMLTNGGHWKIISSSVIDKIVQPLKKVIG